MSIVHRSLYPQLRQDGSGRMSHYTFIGFRRLLGGGRRFGFGWGFIEWGTNTPGIWLPRSVPKWVTHHSEYIFDDYRDNQS